METQRRRRSKWRRFARQNRDFLIIVVVLAFVLSAVVGLMYVLTSEKFLLNH